MARMMSGGLAGLHKQPRAPASMELSKTSGLIWAENMMTGKAGWRAWRLFAQAMPVMPGMW